MTRKQRAQETINIEHAQVKAFEDRLRALIREEAVRAEEQRRLSRQGRRQQRLRRLMCVVALVLGAATFYSYMAAYGDTPPLARVLLSAVALLSVSINGLTAHEVLTRRRVEAP